MSARWWAVAWFPKHWWGVWWGGEAVVPPVPPPPPNPAWAGTTTKAGRKKRRRHRQPLVVRGRVRDPILELLEEVAGPAPTAVPEAAVAPAVAATPKVLVPWSVRVEPLVVRPLPERRPAPLDPALAAALALPRYEARPVEDDVLDWLPLVDAL